MKLADKVIVVTGAGSGIGRAVALALLERGARVAGLDRSAATLEETVSKAGEGAGIAPFVVDVSDRAAVEGSVSAILERFGAVDGVIHCAGIIQPFVRVGALDYETIDHVFAVNWRGTLHMTKTFLPLLQERPEAHLVNVSSMGAFLPVPGQTVYGASKAAVQLFTEGLHSELEGTNVHVTLVLPGAVDTNIVANSGVSIGAGAEKEQHGKITSAEAAASTILEGVEHGRFRVLVGTDAKLMDALERLNPERAAAFIAKRMKGLLE